MEEVWRDIDGYNGEYQVSNLGRVMSCNPYAHKEPKLMSIQRHNHGYRTVGLSRNGATRQTLVHRLVATAFIPNPDGYGFVNHKDENKANNRVDNLEWCTKAYNSNYSLNLHPERKREYGKFFGTHRYKGKPERHREKVLQYSLDGNLLNEFADVVDAHAKTGIKNSAIIACCKGKQKTAFGYKWRFAE